MDERQAAGIPVFEVLQRFVEHHAGHAAVAVNQRELAARVFF
jgi:hypothetical protein